VQVRRGGLAMIDSGKKFSLKEGRPWYRKRLDQVRRSGHCLGAGEKAELCTPGA